ncbi:MAG: diguanylate cyclase [Steroidobacteraceae bacterium]
MSIDAMPIREPLGPDEMRRLIRRSHGLRTLGLVLGTVMVGSVLYKHGATLPVWILLCLHGLVWSHVVRLILHRSARPLETDERCFMLDTAMGGVWIALMQFNLLPSVVLVTAYSMALIAVDGGKLLVRGLALMVLACAVTAIAGGFAFAPRTDTLELLASVPLLVLFPATLSIIVHRLAQRVQRQNRLLLRMSSIDSLSGLLNRRYWEEAVNAALRRDGSADAAMLLIDIDHFKRVNDQYGHAAGDELVRRLGAIVRNNLRQGDLAGRYGGDEFAVMLADADALATERVAERIRSGIACSLLGNVPGMHCTVSIGVAQGRADLRTAAEWLEEADAALYRAKLAGRNRFVTAG